MQEEQQELIMLLKRCAANDRSAQEEFKRRSFLKTVHQAMLEVINEQGVGNRLTREDIRSLVALCVWDGVYRRAEEIACPVSDFHENLRLAAMAMTIRYLNEKIVVR